MADAVFSIPLAGLGNPSASSVGDSSPWLVLRDYVASDENHLIPFAAQVLLERQTQFNPLVLVGGTGVGKSHLVSGLAARWKREHADGKLICTTGGDFARSFAHATELDAVAEFREKHTACELFVLDDLQQMAGKTAAQHEFLVLFDRLVEAGTFVAVTANAPIPEIQNFAPGLLSRLMSGLVIPVQAPGRAACRVVLQRLARFHDVALNSESLDMILDLAATYPGQLQTVPQLNHVLLELAQAAASHNGPIGPDFVRDVVSSQLVSDRKDSQLTLRSITSLVAKQFGLRSAELRGPLRQQSVVTARGIAILLARELTQLSLQQIGRYFGHRDHTTILHAHRRTQVLVQTDPALQQVVTELRDSALHPTRRGKPVRSRSANADPTGIRKQPLDS